MKNGKVIISLQDITKEYHSEEVVTRVLQGISLSIHQGEFAAITGPSGSGKSTLLHIVGLLDTASSGKYLLHDNNVTRLSEDKQADVRNREIGFVFQSFNLLQRASVLENVTLPAIYKGEKKDKREAIGRELLKKVGLSDQMDKRPNQLSGGQQQRVAIARALMNNPSIILADEPTGNLDTKSGKDILEILKDLNKQGKTVIVITHDLSIAKQAKRIIAIKDGKVV